MYLNSIIINVSTERLKWRPMLWQMRESMLCQTSQVCVASDTHNFPSSDWPKCPCAFWCYVNSRPLSEHQTSFQVLVDALIITTMLCFSWKGNMVWGVSVQDVNINSFMAGSTNSSQSSSLPATTPRSNPKPTILISSSESQDITDILSQKFTLREVAGAGYKLLGVCEKLGAGYLLTKSSNYKWDCCGPHAVLLSLGGGIVSYEKFEQMCTSSASNEANHFHIQSLPQIVYNRPDQEEATGAQRWCNVGGIVAYSDPTLLNEVASLLKNRQKWSCN